MGFASNIVIGTAAFLLGMVFVCQVVSIVTSGRMGAAPQSEEPEEGEGRVRPRVA
jgi:hypothetical protein